MTMSSCLSILLVSIIANAQVPANEDLLVAQQAAESSVTIRLAADANLPFIGDPYARMSGPMRPAALYSAVLSLSGRSYILYLADVTITDKTRPTYAIRIIPAAAAVKGPFVRFYSMPTELYLAGVNYRVVLDALPLVRLIPVKASTGTLTINAQSISYVLLSGKDRLLLVDQQEGQLCIPAGFYRCEEIVLQAGNARIHGWPPQGLTVTIQEAMTTSLNLGIPLRQTVEAWRRGNTLHLQYKLQGKGGEVYGGSPFGSGDEPHFKVWMGGKPIYVRRFEGKTHEGLTVYTYTWQVPWYVFGNISIAVYGDIRGLGPTEGERITFDWGSWNALSNGLTLLVLIVATAIAAYRNIRAILIVIPTIAVQAIWPALLGSGKILQGIAMELEPIVLPVAVGIALIGIASGRLARLKWYWRLPLALAIFGAVALGQLVCLCNHDAHYTYYSWRDTVLSIVLAAVSTGLLAKARLHPRKLVASISSATMGASAVAYLLRLYMSESLKWRYLPIGLLYMSGFAVTILAVLLPFLVLVTISRFWYERILGLLGLGDRGQLAMADAVAKK